MRMGLSPDRSFGLKNVIIFMAVLGTVPQARAEQITPEMYLRSAITPAMAENLRNMRQGTPNLQSSSPFSGFQVTTNYGLTRQKDENKPAERDIELGLKMTPQMLGESLLRHTYDQHRNEQTAADHYIFITELLLPRYDILIDVYNLTSEQTILRSIAAVLEKKEKILLVKDLSRDATAAMSLMRLRVEQAEFKFRTDECVRHLATLTEAILGKERGGNSLSLDFVKIIDITEIRKIVGSLGSKQLADSAKTRSKKAALGAAQALVQAAGKEDERIIEHFETKWERGIESRSNKFSVGVSINLPFTRAPDREMSKKRADILASRAEAEQMTELQKASWDRDLRDMHSLLTRHESLSLLVAEGKAQGVNGAGLTRLTRIQPGAALDLSLDHYQLKLKLLELESTIRKLYVKILATADQLPTTPIANVLAPTRGAT